MPENEAAGHERRRSQRIPWSAQLYVLRLSPPGEPLLLCQTVEVNSHGCELYAPRAFSRRSWVRLQSRHGERVTTAHVVHSSEINGKNLWRVGIALNRPGNFWGIPSPPPGWVLTD
jgi:hypothetical protein